MTSMKNLSFLIGCALFTSGLLAHAKFNAVSSEATRFTEATDKKLIGFGKTADFIGVLTRDEMTSIDKDIDVYEFKDRSDLKLNQDSCNQLAKRVMGPLKKISLKLFKSEIKPSASTGVICVYAFSDPDPQARLKEKHLLINILNMRPMGYVFRYQDLTGPEQINDEVKFIESLRTLKAR